MFTVLLIHVVVNCKRRNALAPVFNLINYLAMLFQVLSFIFMGLAWSFSSRRSEHIESTLVSMNTIFNFLDWIVLTGLTMGCLFLAWTHVANLGYEESGKVIQNRSYGCTIAFFLSCVAIVLIFWPWHFAVGLIMGWLLIAVCNPRTWKIPVALAFMTSLKFVPFVLPFLLLVALVLAYLFLALSTFNILRTALVARQSRLTSFPLFLVAGMITLSSITQLVMFFLQVSLELKLDIEYLDSRQVDHQRLKEFQLYCLVQGTLPRLLILVAWTLTPLPVPPAIGEQQIVQGLINETQASDQAGSATDPQPLTDQNPCP
jgi:hypothetical protein